MQPSPRSLLLGSGLLVSTLLLINACATQAPIAGTSPVWGKTAFVAAPTDVVCSLPRLTFDRLKDTLPTIAEIRDQNAKRDKLCGAGK